MTGYWYFTVRQYPDGQYLGENWKCSECGSASYECARFPSHGTFCHNCGAKMSDEPRLIIEKIEHKAEYSWE